MGTIVKPTGISFNDGTVQSTAAQGFPTGTAILFVQSTAPTGWTKSTTHDNKALRVVSGTAGSGGSVAFSTAFASQAVSGSIGATTLSIAQMPSHNHPYDRSSAPLNGPPGYFGNYNYYYIETTQAGNGGTAAQGGGGSHTHSFTGTAINLAVQYVDAIICTKD